MQLEWPFGRLITTVSLNLLHFFLFLAYMSSPCHIEVFLSEKEEVVITKATEEEPAKKKVSKKKLARQKEKMMRE